MNGSKARYETEYLQSERTYLDHGTPPEPKKREDDYAAVTIIATIAVCVLCFALAVAFCVVPVPD